jgi:hypothetical protein
MVGWERKGVLGCNLVGDESHSCWFGVCLFNTYLEL